MGMPACQGHCAQLHPLVWTEKGVGPCQAAVGHVARDRAGCWLWQQPPLSGTSSTESLCQLSATVPGCPEAKLTPSWLGKATSAIQRGLRINSV